MNLMQTNSKDYGFVYIQKPRATKKNCYFWTGSPKPKTSWTTISV